MRVLYMSHRYHTNQNAIMKGWKEHGDEVCFLSQYEGKIEDYTYVKPVVMGYSPWFMPFYKLYVNVLAKNNPAAMDIRLKVGIPPVFKLAKVMGQFRPDLVIMRERSVYTICMTAICRLRGYPAILYVMNPVWEKPKRDLAHRIVWKLVPKYRLTPSLVVGLDYTGKEKDSCAFFAPYLMEPQLSPQEKRYMENGRIRILEVGKYEERKNHKMMVRAFERLAGKYPADLTIVGEVSNDFHRKYYRELEEYIDSHGLGGRVTLKSNLEKADMMEEYKRADLFVLPSTGEPGSVANLEAMAFCVPALCGEDNGTACYIRQGKTGYVCKDNDEDDLAEKMERMVSNPTVIKKMGRNAYYHVTKHFQFDAYYRSVERIMERQRRERDRKRGKGRFVTPMDGRRDSGGYGRDGR